MSEAQQITGTHAPEEHAGEHVVGKVGDLPPGSRTIMQVRNIQIGVFNVNGTYYALHSMCPHQFGPLCHGPVTGQTVCDKTTDWHFAWERDGEVLTCPWHGMQFYIADGQSLTLPDMKIRTYPVRVVDGEVRVQVGRRGGAHGT